MCYVGQQLVFEQASDLINIVLGSGVNAKQIERVCHHYGNWCEDQAQSKIETELFKTPVLDKEQRQHYIGIDGAMYFTKTDGWKELKLARFYTEQNLAKVNSKRKMLLESQYVCDGDLKNFFSKVEYEIDLLENKVFICDGAKWIWNWVDDHYPESTQILDFYHALEYVNEFATAHYKKSYQQKWVNNTIDILKKQGVTPVIKTLERIKKINDSKHVNKILNYFRNNEKRMQYHQYLHKELHIGSGAIESAHRLLQSRLKLSGQRWTKKGLHQMAQLKVLYLSNRKEELIQHLMAA